MTTFLNQPDYRHGTPERIGVLAVNLGTPDDPSTAAVRRYLAEFLWDPRIIEVPRPIWWLVLNLVILRFRPAKSAHAYRTIWTPEGSPLLLHSRALAAGLETTLASRLPGPVKVELAMTYGNPSIAAGLEKLRAAGARRILVLPLYPQYSATTTASIFDRISKELRRWRWLPELRFINQYHDEPAWIAAMAGSIRAHWQAQGRQDHLLFSFHGIPRRYLLNGDPYHCQCHQSARQVAEALGLARHEWSLSFQSRVGKEEWLRPYTDELLREYGKSGPRRITAVCPGFAVDCLETLEEIAIRNRDDFIAAGGESLDYVPCLNDSPDHVALLADLVARHCRGWPEAEPGYDPAKRAEAGAAAAARAIELGAES